VEERALDLKIRDKIIHHLHKNIASPFLNFGDCCKKNYIDVQKCATHI